MPDTHRLGRDLELAGYLGLADAGGEQRTRVQSAGLQAVAFFLCRRAARDSWHARILACPAAELQLDPHASTRHPSPFNFEPLCGIVYLALGRALAHHGELAEAEAQLERALELFGVDSMLVHRAFALLLLASVRHGRGDLPGARALVERARELVERLADPGVLPVLLEHTEEALGSRPHRRVQATAPLTERELAVLRLLPTRLTSREIGRELFVSVNTIRSQVQAVYRKLGVATRVEAVAHARELGLLSRSTPTDR